MSILLNDHGWMDRQTKLVIVVQTEGSCKIKVQTQGPSKTHIVLIEQTKGSCNIVHTQGSCKGLAKSI